MDIDVFAELETLRRQHYYCDDCWYSCPKAEDGCCDESQGGECNCGADEHNARLDRIVAYLRAALDNAGEIAYNRR